MKMGGNFCKILELGGNTIKGWKVPNSHPVVNDAQTLPTHCCSHPE